MQLPSIYAPHVGFKNYPTMKPSPIALFVYNRPHHTRQTIEALQKNELAKKSEIYIFADAPKDHNSVPIVNEVKNYVRRIGGFKSLNIIERDRNLGLAGSLIDGITRLCHEFGRVIVMEDDLVVSPVFLDYMNAALDTYENEERVMHISGYMFPVRRPSTLPDVFFYRGTSCWGWATWHRAWQTFDANASALLRRIKEQKQEHEFDILGTMNYTRMLKDQVEEKIDSWAVRWYASVFLSNGFCLHPARSFVRNIGHDGTGQHCGKSRAFEVEITQAKILRFPKEIVESEAALHAMVDFYGALKGPLVKRVMEMVVRKVGLS